MSELYLVTGGVGFIGSHIVERLVREGQRVRVFDNLSTGKRENIDLIAARDARVSRVIYASSSSIYGDTPTFLLRTFLLFWERMMAKVTTEFEANADIITKKFLEKGVWSTSWNHFKANG